VSQIISDSNFCANLVQSVAISPDFLSFVNNMIKRFKTRVVNVGNVAIGGTNPIRIQSMTNTNTMDTEATVAQAIALYKSGCEMVRITAPGTKEAAHLAIIKKEIINQGYDIPLIADIHYNPKAAEIAAGIVEKVRINPGNYTDRNTGKSNFTEEEYQESIHRIRQRITPLIEICKRNNTALRIGSNHGSLSERILDKYGDTPLGMVESALEFVRICRDMDFHNLVLSMKASNVRIMVYATRILVKEMADEGMNYPIHLGVTEAGDGADGRIKSAVGIGTLLADGIGDTIRVSLTEDPVNEISVVKQIIRYFDKLPVDYADDVFLNSINNPFEYNPRNSDKTIIDDSVQIPLVVGNQSETEPSADFSEKEVSQTNSQWQQFTDLDKFDKAFPQIKQSGIIFKSKSSHSVFYFRKLFQSLHKSNVYNPIILKKDYPDINEPEIAIQSAIDFGPLFVDGFGDGIWISHPIISREKCTELSFQILQASGARISKTEFIACPSCGRTQYNIQKSLQEIRVKTSHLKGLKIAVMGCIVNGPGEMADADYGYVGMGNGKVALFKGKVLVKKGVDETQAVEALIELIKGNGDWEDVV
jgi:(E)-4-hydroxy-3-methylbut-2-enyl-diphosphate synthase